MKNSTFVLFIAVVSLGLIAAIWFGAKSSQKVTTTDNPDRPIAKVDSESYDFGEMSVKEKRTNEFNVTNTGKSVLILSKFATSCDCTYASVIRSDGSESKTFFMHADNNWSEKVQPGQSVKVKVTYDPSIMPVNGYVERYVTFGTNDPNFPKGSLKVTAIVQ